MDTMQQAYIGEVLRGFEWLGRPTRLNSLNVFQCHAFIERTVEPTLRLAEPDARRQDGYHRLLWRWAFAMTCFHGKRLARALALSIRTWAHQGLDPVMMAGLLRQVQDNLRVDEEVACDVAAARRTG